MEEVFDGKAPFEDLGRVADVHAEFAIRKHGRMRNSARSLGCCCLCGVQAPRGAFAFQYVGSNAAHASHPSPFLRVPAREKPTPAHGAGAQGAARGAAGLRPRGPAGGPQGAGGAGRGRGPDGEQRRHPGALSCLPKAGGQNFLYCQDGGPSNCFCLSGFSPSSCLRWGALCGKAGEKRKHRRYDFFLWSWSFCLRGIFHFLSFAPLCTLHNCITA